MMVFLAMLAAYCAVGAAGLAIHAEKTPAFRREDGTYIALFAVIGLAALAHAFRGAIPRGSAGGGRT